MRVFLPVKVFISTSSPARCISEIVSEQSLNAKTAWSRVFGFFGFLLPVLFLVLSKPSGLHNKIRVNAEGEVVVVMRGKEIRLERIMNRNTKKTIIVPMDHGVIEWADCRAHRSWGRPSTWWRMAGRTR